MEVFRKHSLNEGTSKLLEKLVGMLPHHVPLLAVSKPEHRKVFLSALVTHCHGKFHTWQALTGLNPPGVAEVGERGEKRPAAAFDLHTFPSGEKEDLFSVGIQDKRSFLTMMQFTACVLEE